MLVASSSSSARRRLLKRVVVGACARLPARVQPVVRTVRTRARWRLRGPNRDEVLRLLRAHRKDLSASPREVLVRAEGEGVSHATLWQWVRRNGVQGLEVVLAARLGDAVMRRHLANRTQPVKWAVEQLAAEAEAAEVASKSV